MVPRTVRATGHCRTRRLAWLARVVICVASLVVVAGCGESPNEAPTQVPGGDPDRGRELAAVYGCASCHVIPGVREADGHVGPPLTDFGLRSYIAGYLPNNGENLQRWIRDPQGVLPGNAMPDMGVTDDDARDLAAYLFTLR